MKEKEEYLTIKQAGELLNVSISKVYAMVKGNVIQSHKLNFPRKATYLAKSDLERIVKGKFI